MSKIAFTSDIHFGSGTHLGTLDPATGHNSRFTDFISTFDSIVDKLVERGVQYLFIAGDIYKNRQPTPTQQLAFTQALSRLGSNRIHTFITLGNHDMVMSHGKAHTVSIFEELELPYIYVISNPSKLEMGYKGLPCNVFAYPYMNRQTCGIDDNEQIVQNVLGQIQSWSEEIDNDARSIMVGHNIIEGTCVADIQPDVNVLNEPTFMMDFFRESGVDAAFFGHVHEHVIVSEDPLVVSLGSMERIDFNDAVRDKFLTIYETDDNSLELVELPSRQFLNYRADLTGVVGDLTSLICQRLEEEGVDGKIARVLIKIEKDRAPLIMKDRILEILSRAHFSAGIMFKYVESERQEDNVLTDDLQPTVCVEEYLGRLGLCEDDRNRIKDLSISIMQEVDEDIEVINRS